MGHCVTSAPPSMATMEGTTMATTNNIKATRAMVPSGCQEEGRRTRTWRGGWGTTSAHRTFPSLRGTSTGDTSSTGLQGNRSHYLTGLLVTQHGIKLINLYKDINKILLLNYLCGT